MKKALLCPLLFLMLGLLLESCNSSLSVTKRRYQKGYYVHHAAKPGKAKERIENRHQKAKPATAEVQEMAIAEQQSVVENPAEEKNGVVTASARPQKGPHDHLLSSRPSTTLPIELAIKNPVKTIRALSDEIISNPAPEDALSLLWVLILILAIIYVAGLLFNNFGLPGGIIHVLLVIVLVLLILWLLRIL